IWSDFKNNISLKVKETLNLKFTNDLARIYYSGARSSVENISQIVGTRGLMSDPGGKMIDKAINSSFLLGLSSHDFFISTHGARKGLADIAIKTSNSGYLTRKLVDSLVDVLITKK